MAAYTWWSLGLIVLAFIDTAVLRLPHRLTAVTSGGTVLLSAPTGMSSPWRGALIGAALMAGFYGAIYVVSRGGLGLGDVALAVPIGLGVGWLNWRLIIAVALLGHSLAVGAVLVRRLHHAPQHPLPLGTYLAAASLMIVLAGVVDR